MLNSIKNVYSPKHDACVLPLEEFPQVMDGRLVLVVYCPKCAAFSLLNWGDSMAEWFMRSQNEKAKAQAAPSVETAGEDLVKPQLDTADDLAQA